MGGGRGFLPCGGCLLLLGTFGAVSSNRSLLEAPRSGGGGGGGLSLVRALNLFSGF